MSGCECIYLPDGDEEIITLRDVVLTAAKPHVCDSCQRTIAKGQRFNLWQTRDLSDGSILTAKHCLGCSDLAKHFFCDGTPFDLVDWLASHLADQEAAGQEGICCYDGLTPAALEVLEEAVWPEVEKTLPARREWAVRIAEEIGRSSATPTPAPTADQPVSPGRVVA